MLIIRSYFQSKSGNPEFSGLKNSLDLKILTQMYFKKNSVGDQQNRAADPHIFWFLSIRRMNLEPKT